MEQIQAMGVLSRSVMSDSLRPHGLHPPGSSLHGISKARTLGRVAISFSSNMHAHYYSLSPHLYIAFPVPQGHRIWWILNVGIHWLSWR